MDARASLVKPTAGSPVSARNKSADGRYATSGTPANAHGKGAVLQQLQNLADNSPQTRRTRQLQNLADQGAAVAAAQPVQLIRKKAGLKEEEYKNKLRSTVILYAELNGKPVGANGVFYTSGSNHAEDNLITELKKSGPLKGDLKIWLSTSPCSSVFGTRKDDCAEGCQEKLESLHNPPTFSVTVRADHLYQPQELGSVERDNDFKTGFSSASALHTSKFPMSVYKQPAWTEKSLKSTNDDVAQLLPRKPFR